MLVAQVKKITSTFSYIACEVRCNSMVLFLAELLCGFDKRNGRFKNSRIF